MAANKLLNIPPIALTNTLTTNLLNCAITSLAGPVGLSATQPYLALTHIRVTNATGSAAKFSLYKGASGVNAAGTEVVGTGQAVDAHSSYDYYGTMRLDAADFLVGGSDTAPALTLTVEGEIGFA